MDSLGSAQGAGNQAIKDAEHVFKCVCQWLRIRAKYGNPVAADPNQLACDMVHSSLLRRLIKGQEAFPVPPPISFSRPWYSLLESGRAESNYVFRSREASEHLNINQSSWLVQREITASEFLCRYHYLENSRLAWSESLWHVKIEKDERITKLTGTEASKATITRWDSTNSDPTIHNS